MRPHPLADADILEWTVSAAPFSELPELSSPAAGQSALAAPAQAAGRPAWLLPAGAVLAVLAGIGLARAGSDLFRGWELRQVVAAEEQAALRRDVAGLAALSDPAGGPWLDQRLDRVEAGQPAPLPIANLRSTGEAGRVIAVSGPAPDTGWMRVDVARSFVAPDGERYTFALPQFYRRDDAGWRRGPAPPAFWGGPVIVAGRRVTLSVAASDEAYARDLLPLLDSLLERTCPELACPASPISLTFSYNSYQRPDLADLRPGDPLLVGLLPPVITRFPDYALVWPSPLDVGYPREPAGQELLRRAIATQLLFAAIDRAAFGRGSREAVGNAFFLALAARLTVRYGLDTPESLTAPPEPVPEHLDAQEWWDFRYGAARRPDLIRNAGWLLAGWLTGRPAAAEIHLLHALREARSLAEWLALGLEWPLETAARRVAAGLSQLPPSPP